MKKILFVLLGAITIASLPAVMSAGPAGQEEENPRVAEIRSLYQQVVKDRELACMVTDRFEHNTRKLQIPARGPVAYQVTVWRYDEQLWKQANPGRTAPKSWLAQVAYSDCGECSDGKQAYEFLFDDRGQLVFFYQSAPKSMERRYYFTNEKPIRVVEGKDTIDRLTAEHRFFAEGTILGAAYELRRAYMPDIFMK